MENTKKQYHKELQNLEIGLDETITVQLVGKRFRKKALRVHSDKTRLGDDEEFKELVNVCNRLVDAIEKSRKIKNAFVEKHNFAKECSQSWIIYIEKEKVQKWKVELEKQYPEPKHLQGQGTQFKSFIDEKYVYTTLYDVFLP